MSTFLSKLFKPKWQSKNKSVRLEAIKALDPHQAEHQKILIELAMSDPATEVRLQVLQKINDTEALIALHAALKEEDQDKLKPAIEARLYALADNQSLSIFDLIIDHQLLTEMIIGSVNPDAFINGLARLENPQALLKIATQGKTSRIRQAAAELLETEDELKTLTNAVKSKDKGVYQIAKTKLDAIRRMLKQQQEHKALLGSLIDDIEEHARTDNTQLYRSRFEALQAKWREVQSVADEASHKRYEDARAVCALRSETLENEARKAAEEALLEQAGGDEQAATLLTLEETLNRLRESPASIRESASLDAIVKTQETRWLEATRHSKVEKSQSKHYQVLMGELRKLLSALRQLSEKDDTILGLISEIKGLSEQPAELAKTSQTLSALLDTIAWPDNFAKPETITAAEKVLGLSRNIKKQLLRNSEEIQHTIQDLMQQLDASLEDRQIRKSSGKLKKIQSLMSQLNARDSEAFHKRLSLRIKQLNELRDWQGYASSPRQQELCELMERLGEQTLPPQDKAKKIKAMQSEWKSLGGAADEQLWLRFKAASDVAYEPCKAYFEAQTALKDKNLKRRETLINQLEQFIAENDWAHADWKAADQINRKAREEWRAAFPIDHKQNRPLQKTFNKLLAQLDAHLSEERQRNLVLKQAVVERAEALLQQEDLQEAIRCAKALQKEWQNIGITDHKQDRALWKAFRAACDAVFERRDQDRAVRKEEVGQALEEAKALVAEIRKLADTHQEHSVDQLKQALDTFRKQNKQLGKLPREDAEKHQKAFEAGIKDIKAAISKQRNVVRYQQWQEVQRKADMLRSRFLVGKPADDEALDQDFNSQIKLDDELEKQLKNNWISVKAGAVKESQVITNEQAREHCIRCEIASGLESPETDRELRMQLQVTRLSEGMSGAVNQSREEQLSDLLKQWYNCVGLSAEEQLIFDRRIEACVDTLFG